MRRGTNAHLGNMSMSKTFDALVIGAGPAGLAAASLLAGSGLKTGLVTGDAPKTATNLGDSRTVALMQPAMRLLVHLGAWSDELLKQSAPLDHLKVVDDADSAMPANPIVFHASDLSDEPFGWNIPLANLQDDLLATTRKAGVHIISERCLSLYPASESVRVLTPTEQLEARVVVGADGKSSIARSSAGIQVSSWEYGQSAVVASFKHSAAHYNTSIEYHKQAGPLTTVPLPGNRSSLVWMERTERAVQLAKLPGDELAKVLQFETHGDLGLISHTGTAAAIPMTGLTALEFGRARVLLVGEAAHVVPPIGAQGLNMSLRDAALAAQLIGDAAMWDEDPGGDKVVSAYDRKRRRDALPRQGVIDFMNRSLLSQSGLVHTMRSAGLSVVSGIPPLKKFVMDTGVSPVDLPRLMRPA